MILVIYLILLVLFIILFHKNGSNRIVRLLDICLAAFLYVNIVVLATYNNDWEGYELQYNTLDNFTDLGWSWVMVFAQGFGLTYVQFYMIVQALIGFCFLYTVKYFYGRDYTLVMLFVLFFLMPNSSILIRNYFAFAFFLLSLISYCKSKKSIAIFWGVISLTIHLGIIMIFPIFFFKRLVLKYQSDISILIRKCLLFTVVLYLMQTLLFSILGSVGLGVFVTYQSEVSSIQSAAFMLLLYFVVFLYAIQLSKWMLKVNEHLSTKNLMLISANLYTLVFIGLSRIQILYFRLYEPLMLLSFISILTFQYKYYRVYNKQNKQVVEKDAFLSRFAKSSTIFIMIVFMVLHKYYILGLFTGSSEWLRYYRDIILSNEHSILFSAL